MANIIKNWKPIHLCWLFRKLGLPIPRYLIGANWLFTLSGSRFANATRIWQANEDASVIDWDKNNKFIIAIACESGAHAIAVGTLILMWRNKTDDGFFWGVNSLSEEMSMGADTDLVCNSAVTSGEAGCTGSGIWQDGVEKEYPGEYHIETDLPKAHWTEHQWAVDCHLAHDGDEYEFRLYDDTEGIVVGTCLATITMAGGVTHYGLATLLGAGNLTAVAVNTLVGKAITSGIGNLTTIGKGIFVGTVTLAGEGVLAAIGTITGGITHYGAAILSGAGTLVATGVRIYAGKATLIGIGALSTFSGLIRYGAASLSGIGFLNALGGVFKLGVVTLSGIGNLVTSAVMILVGKTALVGAGSLTIKGIVTVIGKTILSGIGELSIIGTTIGGGIIHYGAVVLSGIGNLTVLAVTSLISNLATLSSGGGIAQPFPHNPNRREVLPDMPYPNEHSCRIKQPDAFQKDSFRRMIRDHLVIIIGRLKGQKTTTTQAYRYPIKNWTKKEAREHCKEAKGEFHPATKETQHFILRFFRGGER